MEVVGKGFLFVFKITAARADEIDFSGGTGVGIAYLLDGFLGEKLFIKGFLCLDSRFEARVVFFFDTDFGFDCLAGDDANGICQEF